MGKIYTRKQFSDYLGENRAILDIVDEYVITPTPTPSPTMTGTPTPTPTPTPSSTPFSPPITNLIFHYDFSDSNNVILRSSGGVDYVETVIDLSSNSFDLTQSDPNKQPIYSADTFGNNCAIFDGIDDVIGLTGLTTNTGFTNYSFFCVFEFNEIPPADTEFINGDGLKAPSILFRVDDKMNLYMARAQYQDISLTNKIPNFLLYYRRDLSDSNIADTQLNDTSNVVLINTTNFSDLTGITLGAPFLNSSVFSQVKWKETILYKEYVSDGVKDNIINYLKNKWDYTSW